MTQDNKKGIATKTKYQRGAIAFGLPVLLSIIGFVGAGYGLFYSAIGNANDERDTIKTEVKEDISKDRERISTLEEAVRTIKEDTGEIKSDIKTLLLRE